MSSKRDPVELKDVTDLTDTIILSPSSPDDDDRLPPDAVQHTTHPGTRHKLLSKAKNFVGCRDESADGSAELKKEITVLSGVAFITGSVIGSGIFITPRKIFQNTGSFGLSLVLWLIGGIIALAGGLCYIELASVVKKSGGEYPILLEAYSFKGRNKFVRMFGKVLAFLYSWASVTVIRSLSSSIILLTCARYFSRPFYIDCEVPKSVVTPLALFLLLLVGLVNARSLKFTARVMTILSSLKILALIFIILVGTATIIQKGFPTDLEVPFAPKSGIEPTVSSIAVALYGVTFAYDGWNVMNFAVEETKNVGRTLPISLGIAIPIITACYLLVNTAFFGVLCYDEILSGDTVALVFGERALGSAGLVVIPLLVAVSTLGASLGTMYSASRVIFVAGRDGLFPEVFSGVHKTYGTPVPAITLQVVLASVGIAVGDISILVDGFSAVVFTFYFLVFVALFIMRFTHREIKRPFPIWFIAPVAGFAVLMSVFLVVFPLAQEPLPSVVGFGMVLSGLIVYPVFIADTPWRRHLNKISLWLTQFTKRLLNVEPTSTSHK